MRERSPLVKMINATLKALGLGIQESPLTKEKRIKLAEILQNHLGSRPCTFCGHKHFSVESIFEVKEFHQGNFIPGATMIPFVLIICDGCGYQHTFNAVRLGLVNPQTGKITIG
jgi:hypothetical protein